MVVEELEQYGIHHTDDRTAIDPSPARLIEKAVSRGEGILTSTGALAVTTGKYTGRSPKDRFIVDTPDIHDKIAWGNVNVPFSEEDYQLVHDEVISYLSERRIFMVHGIAGADRRYSRKILVLTELASQALFAHQMLVRPTEEELANYGRADFVVMACPGLKLDPAVHHTHSEAAVIINFKERVVLIAGTQYSGEIKKSIFSVMNYLLPVEENVLTMHCSCNMNPQSHGTTVFFGLSGTGKTTLSAAEGRLLIGDDEHGWAKDSVFNIEGGCYAKTIRISEETEPQIWHAIRFGALCENVVLDPNSRVADYDDDSLTENGRVAYPVEFIDNAVVKGRAKRTPDVVIFLTADAFGVLPPISKLDENAAMYHFMTGFTSKVAGTERGIKEPTPTFSSLFGEPFMPLDPMVYAKMLGEKIEHNGTRVYLINTGWSGGSYGTGSRIKLKYTRKMVEAAQSGIINDFEFVHDERFNLDVPTSCPGVPDELLNPRSTWADKDAYDATAEKLAQMFVENAEKRLQSMTPEVRAAGPHPLGE
ncbi:MAG: phosphoenolpyruvate carboxykinase (ATP) [Olsenella sp.]|jgi:phosphoenolpyruvate carboxykinase (ATP)|nr:phosphoenolpyruvate carboxykinase (ATP) [Olsenella sp.]MCH3957249.1 phosphoenolpyruvate carboxykinase (ATP) [Olsenella sp.]MCI1646578.1 phosphoenolpyruvate carboxykinase (ATP) [Olsenella sp.]MCI1667059.1 phosphoenolpyruvate carboxykinase (ATP) [Olsenella sp.]MCI1794364.1 phosphoenolpyruvate carboxykinase (ATP) [Olsenella sp.]